MFHMERFNHITQRRRRARSAFTLIELLLVLVILAILTSVVAMKVVGRTLQAKVTAAQSDISTLKSSLQQFEIDNDRLPTTEEGLAALAVNPGNMPNWKHAYIDKQPPIVDPWKNPYVYRCPGSNGADFDLFSCGPDGHEGGGDDIQ
jgi:general secretion pathway protein G